jgi:prepilin-type N-terminal cleavage/methylation domain-containing protein
MQRLLKKIYQPKKASKNGFTLIELLLSLAVIAVVAGMGASLYVSYEQNNALDIAAATIVENLRRASVLAEAMEGDTSWGVAVGTRTVTLFRGSSFATRNQNFDEIFELSRSITPSGLSEVVFLKATATPTTSGSIILTSITNATSTITINTKGMVAF